MRQLVIALWCVWLGAPAQQTPTFRGAVTLVTIDVTVLDRDGKPVPGLTAEDFEVKLNGQVQPVRALAYVQAAATAGVPAQGQPSQTSGAVQGRQTATNTAPVGESRVFVILVDDLSFAPGRGKAMFTAAERFVAGLPAPDLVGFTSSTGVGAVNPTADRTAIRAALRAVVGQFSDPRADRSGPPGGQNPGPDQPLGISEALDIDRGDMSALKEAIARECFGGSPTVFVSQTLETVIAANQCASDIQSQARRTAALTKATTGRQVQAYLSVINAMRSATGIKHLVLLSDGLGISQETAGLIPLARAAAEGGVQISVLVEEPDASLTDSGRNTPTQTADPGTPQRRREDDRMFIAGAQTMADMAGGNFHRIAGSPDPFFQRVAVAASAVYRLGVDPPAGTTPGREFAVTATVRRPALTVRANRHAVAPGPVAVVPVEEQMRSAIAKGQPLYGVPIMVATAQRRAASSAQVDVLVNVEVPSTVKGPLTTMFGLVDEAGALRGGRRVVEAPQGGGNYRVTLSLPVAPGKYRLRFAVADAAGTVGSVESAVVAELRTLGPFAASDLLTSFIDASGNTQFLGLADVPATVKVLNVSLELYPATGASAPADVRVRLALTPGGQQQPAIERDVVPGNSAGTLRADAQFPLDQLPPGVYFLRATVFVEGKVIGTASTTISKR